MKRLALAALLFAAAPVAAQEEDDGRATAFQRAEGTQERVPGGTLLVVAYGVIWALVLGFVVLQFRRTQKLESEVDRLTQALKKAGKDGGSG